MSSKFHPLCLDNSQGRALVNSGFILPCCWMDWAYRFKFDQLPEVFQRLQDPELNIKNAESAKEILDSKQWKDFLQHMQNAMDEKEECVVHECNKYCRKNGDWDPTAKRERISNE